MIYVEFLLDDVNFVLFVYFIGEVAAGFHELFSERIQFPLQQHEKISLRVAKVQFFASCCFLVFDKSYIFHFDSYLNYY